MRIVGWLLPALAGVGLCLWIAFAQWGCIEHYYVSECGSQGSSLRRLASDSMAVAWALLGATILWQLAVRRYRRTTDRFVFASRRAAPSLPGVPG